MTINELIDPDSSRDLTVSAKRRVNLSVDHDELVLLIAAMTAAIPGTSDPELEFSLRHAIKTQERMGKEKVQALAERMIALHASYHGDLDA